MTWVLKANLLGPEGPEGPQGPAGTDPTIVAENDEDVRFSIPFEDDYSRTFLEVDSYGRPTATSAGLIAAGAGTAIGKQIGFTTLDNDQGISAVLAYSDDSMLGWWLPDGTYVPWSGSAATSAIWPAVAYGDSTTYGADLTDPPGERWTTLLGVRVGKAINNYGQSSARAEEIQARYGAVVPRATVTGGTVAASGATTLAGFDVMPLRGSNVTSYVVDLRLDNGTLVRGSLVKASSTTATFNRVTPGDPYTATAVDVLSVTGPEGWGRLLFLGQGINNWPLLESSAQTLDQLKGWYTAGASLSTKRIIWGVLDRGYEERPGTARGDWIASLETWLTQRFGTDYAPVRKYLASPRALTDALLYNPAFVPTGQDTTDQTAGTVPASFRAVSGTSVHLNAMGHWLMARYLEFVLRQKGWV